MPIILEKEIWKEIPDMPIRYEASSLGRIKRCSHVYVNSNGIVRPMKEKIFTTKRLNKYLVVPIRVSQGVHKTNYIHRLIAITFIENKTNLTSVNHINGIKSDNRVENLEWVSCKENSRHAKFVLGKLKNENQMKKVKCLTNGQVYKSCRDAAIQIGIPDHHINTVARGVIETTHGYKFKYV